MPTSATTALEEAHRLAVDANRHRDLVAHKERVVGLSLGTARG